MTRARKLDCGPAIFAAFREATKARAACAEACDLIAAQLGTERTWDSAQAIRDLERELEAVAQEAARALDLLHPHGNAIPMRERVNRALGYPSRPAKEARRLHAVAIGAARAQNGGAK